MKKLRILVVAVATAFCCSLGCGPQAQPTPPALLAATTVDSPSVVQANKLRKTRGLRQIKRDWRCLGVNQRVISWQAPQPQKLHDGSPQKFVTVKEVVYNTKNNQIIGESDTYYSGNVCQPDPDHGPSPEFLTIDYDYKIRRSWLFYWGSNYSISMRLSILPPDQYLEHDSSGYLGYSGHSGKTNKQTLSIADEILKHWHISRL